jgi:hypothetical protein
MSGVYIHNQFYDEHERYPAQRSRGYEGSDVQEGAEIFQSQARGSVYMYHRPPRASAAAPPLSDWEPHEQFAQHTWAQTWDDLRPTTYNGAYHDRRTFRRQRPTSSPTYRTTPTSRPVFRTSDLDFHGPEAEKRSAAAFTSWRFEDSSIGGSSIAHNAKARVRELEQNLLACHARLKDSELQLAAKNLEIDALEKRAKSLEKELKQSIYTSSVLATSYNENTHKLMESLKREREERESRKQIEPLPDSNSLNDQWNASPSLAQGRGKALYSAAAAIPSGKSEVEIESRALLQQASQVF